MSTGKTSLINLIIQKYYSNNSNYSDYSDNVLNINSLYDQGISQLRQDIRTFCQTYSVIPNKKKFIVLDDIDYIPVQNQQILRNFIDKYTNVFFLMSCSNINKVVESLQSKQYMIKLNNFDYNSLMYISKNVIKNEKINISNEALDFLIKVSNYSIRVILNYFDKIKILDNPGEKNLDYVKSICTNIKYEYFDKYLLYLKNGDIKEAIELLDNYYDSGFSVIDILDVFFEYIKYTNIIHEELKYHIIEHIIKSIIIFNEIHEDDIELSFFTLNLYRLIQKNLKFI
jgi:DNA polymerase III delta prime subunit